MSEPLLELSGVGRRFGGIVALARVDLRLEENESVGLIGPNGAGKTTLFDCVSGLTHPDRGTIRFKGRRIDSWPVYRRARAGIGRTFQRVELFTGFTPRQHFLVAESARRNDGRVWRDLIGRGQPRADEIEQVEAIIAELGLEEIADAPVEALSLGQGRLVELGRALIGEPELLLLDEPSSGLDWRETTGLAATLQHARERRKVALLLVEHDLDLVRLLSDRVVALDSGRVVAEGSMDEVVADPAVQAAYIGTAVAT